MIKVKNKTYTPITLSVADKSIIVPGRKSVEVDDVTPQILALKNKGLIQVIKVTPTK
jgi:hypothetical protein